MTAPALRDRPCPGCGSTAAAPEVRSAVPAETRSLDELRPFWFGIDKERQFFTYHRCAGCGLLYAPSYFEAAQLGALYAAMPPNMDLVPSAAIVATQRGYFAAAARAGELTGDYLEIGPDLGHVAAEAARHGAFDRFWLCEPNRAVHAPLRDALAGRDAMIIDGLSDLSAVPENSVGLAVMVHVLDHLLDPRAMLAAIHARLRPGGMVMIVTHNERSLLRRLLGARWPAFCLQHPELYNPDTIRRLVAKAGFDDATVIRSRNHFPIDFLARQALATIGLRPSRLPLPSRVIGLRLGNILTLARRAPQAASTASITVRSRERAA